MNKIEGAWKIPIIYALRTPNAFYLAWFSRPLRSEHVIIVMFATSFLEFGVKKGGEIGNSIPATCIAISHVFTGM